MRYFTRSLILRVLAGLLIGIGMFYFRSANAQTGSTTPYWGTVNSSSGAWQYYGMGDDVSRYDPQTRTYTRIPANSTGPTNVRAAGYQGAASAATGGPTMSTQRALALSRRGAATAVAETIKFPRPVLASAVRTLARVHPLVMVGLGAYSYFQDDKIRYDQPMEQWVKDVPGPLKGNAVVESPGSNPGTTTYPDVSLQTFDSLQRQALLNSPQRAQCLQFNNQACVNDNTPTQVEVTGACSKNGVPGTNHAMRTVHNTLKGSYCGVPGPGSTVPATDSDLEEAWRNGNGPSMAETPAQEAEALNQIADRDIPTNVGLAPTTVTPPTQPVSTPLNSTTETIRNADGTETIRTTERTLQSTVQNNTITNERTFNRETLTVRETIRTIVRENNVIVNTREDTSQPTPPSPEPRPPEEEPEPETENPKGAFTGPGGAAKTFAQSASDFRSRVAAAPVVQGITTLADAVPTGGACPTASFDAFGRMFTLDAHCPLLDQYKALIAAVFLLGWALYSIVLFFKA